MPRPASLSGSPPRLAELWAVRETYFKSSATGAAKFVAKGRSDVQPTHFRLTSGQAGVQWRKNLGAEMKMPRPAILSIGVPPPRKSFLETVVMLT